MTRIAILSTDTAHHRYFVNRLVGDGIPVAGCVFETTSVAAPFPVGPVFEDEQDRFEERIFFVNTRRTLDGIPVQPVANINTPEGHKAIDSLSPTLGVVFGTRPLTSETIGMFPDGLLNVHRGMPQDYRGLDSDLWAIYHRDWGNIGATIHFIEPQLDTGAIVAQERLRLIRSMKCHEIRYHTTVSATRMMTSALADYLKGRLSSTPQERRGRYYSFMPRDLRHQAAQRFDRYCAALNDGNA